MTAYRLTAFINGRSMLDQFYPGPASAAHGLRDTLNELNRAGWSYERNMDRDPHRLWGNVAPPLPWFVREDTRRAYGSNPYGGYYSLAAVDYTVCSGAYGDRDGCQLRADDVDARGYPVCPRCA